MEEQEARTHTKSSVGDSPETELGKPQSTSVVVFGNPFDGLNLVGPFANTEDANSFADSEDDSRDWWVVRLDAAPDGFGMPVPTWNEQAEAWEI